MNSPFNMIQALKKQVIFLLLELRKEGISKTAISQATEISRPTLDKMFEGQIDNLTLNTIEKLFTTYPKYLPGTNQESKEEVKNIQTLLESNARLIEQLEIITNELKRKNKFIDELQKRKD